MKKEDLIKLKRHLASFTEEERKIRDEYLKGIATGQISGEQTGYPSVDMPQLAYYDLDKYHAPKDAENITYSLMEKNANNLDGVALEYFGGKITYKEFFERIGDLMKALAANGVKEGDYVAVSLPGMPEGMTSAYALAGLGAVSMFVPPYFEHKAMASDFKYGKVKILIIMDALYSAFKQNVDKAIEEAGIEKVVVVPTLNSSPLRRIKKSQPIPKGFISYNDFIKEGKSLETPKIVPYKENMPVAVVYSSGSTGNLKAILLSHDTINNSAHSYYAFGFDLSQGQVIYQVIPPFASTGLIASGTTALYFGCTLYENPQMVPLTFSKNLGLHKVNWGVATTALFEGLDEVRKQRIFKALVKTNVLDYRNLRNVYIGGTLTTEKNKAKLNAILKSVGCPSEAKRSYGNCENGSIVTAELNGVNHPANSVGIPIPGAVVMAIDENGVELPYNTRGELVVKTDCGMIDYFNRPELSKNVFLRNEADTETFKHTGDIGYIMPTGDVIYEGRASDFSLVDGLKLYNFDVKNVILEDPDVYDAEVMTNNGGMFCVHLQFYEGRTIDIEQKIGAIQRALYKKFGDTRYVPEYYKLRQSFPMAKSTKRDILSLKWETEGFVHVPNVYLSKESVKQITL